jgi:hypothetical protein
MTGVRARTVCAAAAMFALAGCATSSAGVGYAAPAYADANACYYPGYAGVCSPYYWDGYAWHGHRDYGGWHRAFHGGGGMAHGGFAIAHSEFGGHGGGGGGSHGR